MKKASGIVSVALPFTAGTVAAALVSSPFCTALAGSALAAAAFILSLLLRQPRLPVALLFAALGAVCWSTSALSGSPRLPTFPRGADMLEKAIAAAGFPGENSGAIITALLTGRRNGLPRATVEAFRRSGASHILALSGLHLGIIYSLLRRLLSPIGNTPPARTLRSTATVSLCGAYALATGAGPSIVRALLFIIIGEIGRACSQRKTSPAGTFCTALTVQLALQPSLIASAGFQMSYLAMLGITALFPRLDAWYPQSGRPDPLRRTWRAAALSISCQLFTAPVAWWHFRTFPKYFLLTNLLSLPLAEAVIVTAVASLLLAAAGLCPPALISACGKLTVLLESCLETIASI